MQVKFSKEEKKYLDIISKIYGYKMSQFVRDAVKEKMIRDVPKLRERHKEKLSKKDCPFWKPHSKIW